MDRAKPVVLRWTRRPDWPFGTLDKPIDVAAVKQWMTKLRKPRHAGSLVIDTGPDDRTVNAVVDDANEAGGQSLAEKTILLKHRHIIAQTARIELKRQIEAGDYTRTELVREFIAASFADLRASMLRMPRELAALLRLNPQAEDTIHDIVHRHLSALAAKFRVDAAELDAASSSGRDHSSSEDDAE